MENEKLVEKVQALTDIELAILLCLVGGEHCMIQTDPDVLEALQEELQLIASNVFGLAAAVIQCSETTTLDEFSNAILVEADHLENDEEDFINARKRSSPNRRVSEPKLEHVRPQDTRKLPNIIIAKDLNLSPHQIQIQALELIRTRHIFTHTAFYTAPKPFLIIALTAASSTPLVKHLNDHIFISHYHSPDDGFPNLEEGSEWVEDDKASISSVVHRSVMTGSSQEPLISHNDIQELSTLSDAVTTTAEVKRYLQNIITFLRLHRAVVPGSISPRATKYFDLLIKLLAPFHSLVYTTPSLVALAARKIYRHRIAIVAPEEERSMQYGSDIAAVRVLLKGVTAETVIEEVLGNVEAPL